MPEISFKTGGVVLWILWKRGPEITNHFNSFIFQLSVVLLLPALIAAAPEAEADASGHGIAVAGACQTVTETVLTKVCATAYDKRCSQSAKTKYQGRNSNEFQDTFQ